MDDRQGFGRPRTKDSSETLMDTVMTNGSKFEGLGMNTGLPAAELLGTFTTAQRTRLGLSVCPEKTGRRGWCG